MDTVPNVKDAVDLIKRLLVKGPIVGKSGISSKILTKALSMC